MRYTHRDEIYEAEEEIAKATLRYGDFSSTHEALGVLAEEMAELKDAIRANALESIRMEAIQVAAVALRLAENCRTNTGFQRRSGK